MHIIFLFLAIGILYQVNEIEPQLTIQYQILHVFFMGIFNFQNFLLYQNFKAKNDFKEVNHNHYNFFY